MEINLNKDSKNIPNILYIASAGHSGSTLLDFLIGSLPHTFSTGELVYFPWQIYRTIQSISSIKNQNICTCGNSFFNCKVWGEVIKMVKNNMDIDMRQNPFLFDISIHRSPSYKDNFKISNKLIRTLYYLFSFQIFGNPINNIYYHHYRQSIHNNWKLFRYLYNITGARYIIDSTKDPIRFKMLHRMHPNNIKLIILIRNVHGVATSGLMRQEHNNIEKAAKGWLKFYNNKIIKILKSTENLNYLIIHYEELTKHPEKIIRNIANFLEIDNFHLIAGNPMRYKNNFTIKYDKRWKNHINDQQYDLLDKYQNKLNPIFTLQLDK